MAVLDEFLASADPTDSSSLIAHQLEDRGGIPVIVPPDPMLLSCRSMRLRVTWENPSRSCQG